MGENTSSSGSQDATLNESDPKAATATTTATDATSGTTTEPSLADLQEQIKRMDVALKKANADAKNHRIENDELRKFKEQAESAQLSETEKRDKAAQQREKQLADLQRERDEARLKLQEVSVNAAIQVYAIGQGIDPKLAQRLLDRTVLEYDDAGQPTNLDTVFKAMVKEFNLTGGKPTPTGGGATSPARSQSQPETGEITASYVSDVMSGKIPWQSLTPERRMAILNWQAKNPYRF